MNNIQIDKCKILIVFKIFNYNKVINRKLQPNLFKQFLCKTFILKITCNTTINLKMKFYVYKQQILALANRTQLL